MVTVVPMNVFLANNPASRFGGEAQTFRNSARAGNHLARAEQGPDTFVVTPDGEAHPGIRELHVDADGSLRIVGKPRKPGAPDFALPTHASPASTLPQLPNAPYFRSPASPAPMIGWKDRPSIQWNRPFDRECPRKKRETVQIFVVAEDGTTVIQEVAQREYHKRHAEKDLELKYVVEENGVVHRANCVFIGGPEAEVILRAEEDDGAVFDKVRTPQPKMTPFSDIVFIVEENGRAHHGTTVMIADEEGKTTILNRIATWPALFVTNTTDKPMYLAYTVPKHLSWKTQGVQDRSTNDCFVIEHANGVCETYNRILLASNESVFLAYRSACDTDAIIVSDGKSLKAACLIKKPRLEADMTPIIVTGPTGVSQYGVNIFISSPNGFIPVGRVASVSKDVRSRLQNGAAAADVASTPMLVAWPQRLCILNEPHTVRGCATKTLQDKMATKLADKCPHLDEPLPESSKSSPMEVIIATPDRPGI
eukprot:gene6069-9325_t